MQDIIPPRRNNRVAPRVARSSVRHTVAPRGVGYTTRTRTVTDIITPEKEVIITKTVTSTYTPPVVIEKMPATKAIESLTADDKVEVLQRALLIVRRELRREHRKHRGLGLFSR